MQSAEAREAKIPIEWTKKPTRSGFTRSATEGCLNTLISKFKIKSNFH